MRDIELAEHNSRDCMFRYPVGAVGASSTVDISLHLKVTNRVNKVTLRIWQDNVGERLLPMSPQEQYSAPKSDAERAFYRDVLWTVPVTVPGKGCLLWYYFIIETPVGKAYYGNNSDGLGGEGVLSETAPTSFQITVYDKAARTPDWFKNAVMYQIFPDRFYRAEQKTAPKKGAVIHAAWDDEPCYFKDEDTKEIVAYDFFGGNLAGIREKLPYLKELGITVIYLNPIFEAVSNHRYDTGDYHRIDPLLGEEADLVELTTAAERNGIRVIIDGVFSHTGAVSRYFNQTGSYASEGACQSKNSPYYRWYSFKDYPNVYDSWWGFGNLPEVDETDPTYIDFIISGQFSVLHHWMNCGIKGWRLDVLDELPAAFSKKFFAELKKTDPEAVLIGEVWEDASNKVSYGVSREYLSGHEVDGVMNYLWRDIVLDFLLGVTDGAGTARRIASMVENYPPENLYAMMNLLGSHDVERLVNLLAGAPASSTLTSSQQRHYELAAADYSLGRSRSELAALWQLTFPGVPSIYYGDEIGMQGFKDPTNRRPYRWEDGDDLLQEWYSRAINFRRREPALSTGEFVPLEASGDSYSFARVISGGKDAFGEPAENAVFVTFINRNATESVEFSVTIGDLAAGTFRLALSAGSAEGLDRYVDSLIKSDDADAASAVSAERLALASLTEVETLPSRLRVRDGRLRLMLPPLSGAVYSWEKPARRFERKAGILMPPTSLPSRFGVGDIGQNAKDFIDWLVSAGQKVWQILPLGPIDMSGSPYSPDSAFAGNTLLISPTALSEAGLVTARDIRVPVDGRRDDHTEYAIAAERKEKIFRRAWNNFTKGKLRDKATLAKMKAAFATFRKNEAGWLEDYALYRAIKDEQNGRPWTEWPDLLRNRDEAALERTRQRLADEIGYNRFCQFLFHSQWAELKKYAAQKGVEIIGDMPFFVSLDSADVWAGRENFDVDENGRPRTVAGVPPDYFSEDGQLWGNPQYLWDRMANDGYQWWIDRFAKLFRMVDVVRIDHFRGMESYWEIPGDAATAREGKWVTGPGASLFAAVRAAIPKARFIAEDLGVITPAVTALRQVLEVPGMTVLQFGMGENCCHRVGCVPEENSVIYTGTHDNNTVSGWYEEDLTLRERELVRQKLKVKDSGEAVAAALMEYAYRSDARLAVTPIQDVLGLGSEARLNTPGTVEDNWSWRLKSDQLSKKTAWKLRQLALAADRLTEK